LVSGGYPDIWSSPAVKPGASRKESLKGAAYVFVRSGASWTEQQKLIASDGAASDLFGESVAVSGDTAAVGAYGKASYHLGAYK
jgi:hypothetical protein